MPLAEDVSFTLDAPFNYATVLAAGDMLMTLSGALGPRRGTSAEKSMAAIPETCRQDCPCANSAPPQDPAMVGKDLHNIFGTMHRKNINEDMQTYEMMNSFCSAFRSQVPAVLAAGHEYVSAQRPPRE